MPTLHSLDSASRAAGLAALLLATSLQACDGGGSADRGAGNAAGFEDGGDAPARIDVDACELLTKEEISEQLFLSVSPAERSRWTSREFDISATAPELGGNPRCEYRFESRDSAGGGPTWHSDFDMVVLPANTVPLAESDRAPISGAGADMFKERGTQPAYYVVKGRLAVALSRFPGRDENEEGGADAGRLLLLRRIAERLP